MKERGYPHGRPLFSVDRPQSWKSWPPPFPPVMFPTLEEGGAFLGPPESPDTQGSL